MITLYNTSILILLLSVLLSIGSLLQTITPMLFLFITIIFIISLNCILLLYNLEFITFFFLIIYLGGILIFILFIMLFLRQSQITVTSSKLFQLNYRLLFILLITISSLLFYQLNYFTNYYTLIISNYPYLFTNNSLIKLVITNITSNFYIIYIFLVNQLKFFFIILFNSNSFSINNWLLIAKPYNYLINNIYLTLSNNMLYNINLSLMSLKNIHLYLINENFIDVKLFTVTISDIVYCQLYNIDLIINSVKLTFNSFLIELNYFIYLIIFSFKYYFKLLLLNIHFIWISVLFFNQSTIFVNCVNNVKLNFNQFNLNNLISVQSIATNLFLQYW